MRVAQGSGNGRSCLEVIAGVGGAGVLIGAAVLGVIMSVEKSQHAHDSTAGSSDSKSSPASPAPDTNKHSSPRPLTCFELTGHQLVKVTGLNLAEVETIGNENDDEVAKTPGSPKPRDTLKLGQYLLKNFSISQVNIEESKNLATKASQGTIAKFEDNVNNHYELDAVTQSYVGNFKDFKNSHFPIDREYMNHDTVAVLEFIVDGATVCS